MRQGLIVESTAYGVGTLMANQGHGAVTFRVMADDGSTAESVSLVADYIRVNNDGTVMITLVPEGICPVTGR
jgi:hypothetical protein